MFGKRILTFGKIELAAVTTDAASSVAGTSFTANGNLTSIGGGAGNVSVGFYIGTNASYLSNTKYTVSTNASTGAYTYNATGLTAGTTYYITAFAINDGGESIGTTTTQATSFVPQFVASSTSTYYGKSSGNSYPNTHLSTQFYNTSTTAYVTADYFETGQGATSAGYSYFYGGAPHILNGCRGVEYGQSYSTGYWGSGSTCQPRLRCVTNTTNRVRGGTWFQYWTNSTGAVLNTQNPSGYSMTNRVQSTQGVFAATHGTSNTGQMVSTVTTHGGQNAGQSGFLVHEFDLT